MDFDPVGQEGPSTPVSTCRDFTEAISKEETERLLHVSSFSHKPIRANVDNSETMVTRNRGLESAILNEPHHVRHERIEYCSELRNHFDSFSVRFYWRPYATVAREGIIRREQEKLIGLLNFLKK